MTTRRAVVSVVWLAVWLAMWSDEVRAERASCPPLPPSDELQQAQKLADEGFASLTRLQYLEAADSYVRALAHARDPRMHLQAGTAFFNALRMVDAYEHLSEALRCGRELLDGGQIVEAERKLKILASRLGQVTVDCSAQGAQVKLGDERWFTCPGRETQMVATGRYVVEVSLEGHFPVLETITVLPGKNVIVTPRVLSIAAGTIVKRQAPGWYHWALVGAGAALGVAAGGMHLRARGRVADVTDGLADCENSIECTQEASEQLFQEQDSAMFENNLALGALAVGGALAVTGATLMFFNKTSQNSPAAGTAGVQVAPMVGRDGAGVSLRMNF